MTRKNKGMTPRNAPMRFMYSSKMSLESRLFGVCVILVVGAHILISPQTAAKNSENISQAITMRFADVTQASGISFQHTISPEKKYLIESMAGGVLLLDYDGDGWLDIYFTNAPTVDRALHGQKAKSALYRNNHDGTFTDVTDKAGVGYPCWAMGGAVADYNNDGWPDMLITCAEGMVLYRNNGNGTFSDTTK